MIDDRFKGKTKDQLEAIMLGIESYMEGVANAWNMMNDFYKELQDLGKDHLREVNLELRKVSDDNSK